MNPPPSPKLFTDTYFQRPRPWLAHRSAPSLRRYTLHTIGAGSGVTAGGASCCFGFGRRMLCRYLVLFLMQPLSKLAASAPTVDRIDLTASV